jgi:hypothetical protein
MEDLIKYVENIISGLNVAQDEIQVLMQDTPMEEKSFKSVQSLDKMFSTVDELKEFNSQPKDVQYIEKLIDETFDG